MGIANEEVDSFVRIEAKVVTGERAWTTEYKVSSLSQFQNPRTPKEMAIEALESLVAKLKSEVSNGNLS